MKKLNIQVPTITAVMVVLLLTGSSFRSGRKNDINKAGWLIGTWENKTSRGSTFETWRKLNSNEFSGKSYKLKQNDTIVFETIQLVQKDDALYYIPTVKDQNDGRAIQFSSTLIDDTRMVFENPLHDFPQTISYTLVSKDSLLAEISGVEKGKRQSMKYSMTRTK